MTEQHLAQISRVGIITVSGNMVEFQAVIATALLCAIISVLSCTETL